MRGKAAGTGWTRVERTPMTIEIPRFLTKTQADLVRETEPHRMDELDEDTLSTLR